MRRTKIVCTIGPSIDTPEQIKKAIEAGMDVARLNLSHGSKEDHFRRLQMIREASSPAGNVGILFDTRGPEVRTGKLVEEPVYLEEGQDFVLTTEPVIGEKGRVGVTYPGLHDDLKPGSVVLIEDGLITLEVKSISGQEILCRVVYGGELRSYKGINMPGTKINLPALGEEDRDDLKVALEYEFDFLAASFTRSAEDIMEIRRLVEDEGGRTMILAKIESREGVENYNSILDVADGVMIARGDLGVEVRAEEVPLLQKRFIAECNRLGKPVITATQMLDSMIRNPYPTRAEASDVANAIIDGTDAVMLSGETAVGRYPTETIETMARIAAHTEEGLNYSKLLEQLNPAVKKTVTDAISYSTCNIALELGADAIITSTQSGHTARMVSKYRPRAPIVAVSFRRQVASQLTLTRGVQAVICPPVNSTDEMFNIAMQTSLEEGLIKNGDLVIITAGVPVGVSGTTNLLRVETVGEAVVKGTGIGKVSASANAFVVEKETDLDHFEAGQIMVAKMTDKKLIPIIEKAAALITEEGGLTSHGAVVAINLGIPAVVGAEKAIDLIENGETITVDANRGLVYRGKAHVR
ncbi:MAG: pyruvate kinase [Bacillota bacterium]